MRLGRYWQLPLIGSFLMLVTFLGSFSFQITCDWLYCVTWYHEDFLGVTVIVVGKERDDLSSNPRRDLRLKYPVGPTTYR